MPNETNTAPVSEAKKGRKQRDYSFAEHEAAKMAYFQLGRERSLEKIAHYSGIALGTLKMWSSKECWEEWVKSQESIQETLALRGLYDPQTLFLNEEAKALLNQIIRKGSALLDEHKIALKGNDVTLAAKLALDLTKNMATDEKESGPDWPEDVTTQTDSAEE